MSIRRKSTTHDLATLRLHPDGSRVQQSSSSARQRTAKYTVIDPRGNWIAQDAGGRASVKKRRTVSAVPDDEHRETTRTSPERDGSDSGGRGPRLDLRRRSRGKGKQRASEEEEQGSDLDGEPEPLDTRTRQRLSFMQDFNFLDPPEVVTGLPVNPEGSHGEDGLSLPHPTSELLKSIHHFASCYYRERDQLSDSSRSFREEKKQKHNIHILAADGKEGESPGTDGAMWEEDEEGRDGDDDDELVGKDVARDIPQDCTEKKDMYKAFDGSALMAIGILLQEEIAHVLSEAWNARETTQG